MSVYVGCPFGEILYKVEPWAGSRFQGLGLRVCMYPEVQNPESLNPKPPKA